MNLFGKRPTNSGLKQSLLAENFMSESENVSQKKSVLSAQQEKVLSIPLAIANNDTNPRQQEYLEKFLTFCQFIPELNSQNFSWTDDHIYFQSKGGFSVLEDTDNPGISILVYKGEYHVLWFDKTTGQIPNDAVFGRNRYLDLESQKQNSRVYKCQRMYMAQECMGHYDKTDFDVNDVRTGVLRPYRAWVEQMQHPTLEASTERNSPIL